GGLLKKSRKSSSNCGSLGRDGGAWVVLLRATFCEVEILTTASITCSATSAILSGPRATVGVVSAGNTIAEMATAAKAGRRACRVNRARVPSMASDLLRRFKAKTVRLSGH